MLRPSGTVDVLIGYEYASYHPQNEQSSGHLVLLRNRFGRCIGGTHPTIREKSTSQQLHQIKVNTAIARIEDFYNIENLGIDLAVVDVNAGSAHWEVKTSQLRKKKN